MLRMLVSDCKKALVAALFSELDRVFILGVSSPLEKSWLLVDVPANLLKPTVGLVTSTKPYLPVPFAERIFVQLILLTITARAARH